MDYYEVECDECGGKETIQAGQWGTYCNNEQCTDPLLLAPVRENMRYVCCEHGQHSMIHEDELIYKCGCGEQHAVGADVVAVRTHQNIYRAVDVKEAFEMLCHQLESSRDEMNEANILIEQLNEELTKTQEDKKKQEQVACDLRKDRDHLRDVCNKREADFNRAQKEALLWESRCKGADDAFKKVLEEKKQLEESLKTEAERLTGLHQEENNILKTALKNEETKRQQAIADVEKAKAAVEELEGMLKTAQEEREVVREEIRTAHTRNDELVKEKKLMEEEVSRMMKEKDCQANVSAKLREQYSTSLEEAEGFLQKKEDARCLLQKELELLKQKMLESGAGDGGAKYESELEALKQDIERLKDNSSALEHELELLKQAMKNSIKEGAADKKQLELLKQEKAILEAAVNNGDTQVLFEAEKAKSALENELEEMKLELLKERLGKTPMGEDPNHQRELAMLNNQVELLEKEKEALQNQAELLKGEKGELQKTIDAMENEADEELEEAKEAFQQSQRDLENLDGEVNRQRNKVANLEKQNAQLIQSLHAALVGKASDAASSISSEEDSRIYGRKRARDSHSNEDEQMGGKRSRDDSATIGNNDDTLKNVSPTEIAAVPQPTAVMKDEPQSEAKSEKIVNDGANQEEEESGKESVPMNHLENQQ